MTLSLSLAAGFGTSASQVQELARKARGPQPGAVKHAVSGLAYVLVTVWACLQLSEGQWLLACLAFGAPAEPPATVRCLAARPPRYAEGERGAMLAVLFLCLPHPAPPLQVLGTGTQCRRGANRGAGGG